MKEKKSNKINFGLWILLSVIIVAVLFAIIWYITFKGYSFPENSNEFGDSFGMANALFSALAFAFLIVTALMQRKELELQRKELMETRYELKKSVTAQDASQQALNIQVRIMAKQAMLTSYQSLYQLNLDNSRNRVDPIKDIQESKKEAKVYLGLIEHMVKELEKEQELFGNPDTIELIKLARQL